MKMKWLVRFILLVGKARWVVDSELDVGFSLFGVNVINYKWNDSFICYSKNDKENPCRLAEKRELISRNNRNMYFNETKKA
jgi:hypothetical protein